MRREVQQYLSSRPDLRFFVRMNPDWYKRLSRNPYQWSELEREAKVFYGQTFAQKAERLSQQLKAANLMLGLAQVYFESNQESESK